MHTYIILPVSDLSAYPMARSSEAAQRIAQDLATFEGTPQTVVSVVCTLAPESNTDAPLHEEYGVVPGVDFPFTLCVEKKYV